jgi:hypothetical protein
MRLRPRFYEVPSEGEEFGPSDEGASRKKSVMRSSGIEEPNEGARSSKTCGLLVPSLSQSYLFNSISTDAPMLEGKLLVLLDGLFFLLFSLHKSTDEEN